MRMGAKSALGLAVSALLLWYAFKGIDLTQVMSALRGSALVLGALCTIASQLIFPLRARRWRTILDPVAPRLPFGPLWRATAIGMMCNNVLPALARWPHTVEALVGRVTGVVLPKYKDRIGALVHSLAAGLAVVRDPVRFLATFLWAVAHWLVNAPALWLGFR